MPATERHVDYHRLLKRYAVYAPRYDSRFARYSARTLSKALEAIPLEGRSSLLDVACGTGLLAEMLRRQRPGLRITGVDISPQMLEQARQRISPVPGQTQWLRGHAEDLPVESDQFDVLTCTNAFHLVQDAPAALAEFRRALRPGGTLVLVDWCNDFALMRLFDATLRIIDRQRRRIRRLRDLQQIIEAAGFTIEHAGQFKAGMWGMMCVVARQADVSSVQRDPHPAATVSTHRLGRR